MNIALIIFPIHPSHGCILQTYALQQVLTHEGHNVTIIDRQWNKPGILSNCKDWVKLIIGRISGKPMYLRSLTKKILISELTTFIDSKLKNRKVYYQNPSFEEFSDVDAFIVGSDQTWRPKYVSDVKCYYLSFVPKDANVKRIAYAPSFGTDDWEYSSKLTEECGELLKKFDAVSVREESGVKLCKLHYNVDASHVLDPTMLLTKEDYLKATGLSYSYEDIASYYLLDQTPNKMSIVDEVCKTLRLRPQRINTETENPSAPVDQRIAPSIEKWIGGFARSKFIIADSFHATVFAIIFNKPFITIANPTRGLSRFESILHKVGLIDRMIFNIDDLNSELLHDSIDWDRVNNVLLEEQKKSKEFINKNLEKN